MKKILLTLLILALKFVSILKKQTNKSIFSIGFEYDSESQQHDIKNF